MYVAVLSRVQLVSQAMTKIGDLEKQVQQLSSQLRSVSVIVSIYVGGNLEQWREETDCRFQIDRTTDS